MRGDPVTVAEISEARERRALRQRQLLRENGGPLISFSLNLPGEIKRFSAADALFYGYLRRLETELGGFGTCVITAENTGLEAIIACRCSPEELKRVCVALEESEPAARLCDLDVLDAEGHKLTRDEPRTCLICGGPAAYCARSRAHGLDALKARTANLLKEYYVNYIADAAVDALLWEARLTPKPGLVDAENSGAHRDMSLEHFERSALALRSYFRKAAALGFSSADCMPELIIAGVEAEKTMLEITGGVNTHRGAIYLMGLLAAGYGRCAMSSGDPLSAAAAFAAQGIHPERESHGERVRRLYGDCGPRAEARKGLPNVRFAAERLSAGEPATDTLLRLILRTEDTNLLYRGGEEGLRFARAAAERVLAAPPEDRLSLLREMDRELTGKNLSPGGCADLLACGRFCSDMNVSGSIQTKS